ncbi:hypothetical protein ACIBKY_38495 [Nonomuraea sp. NPDC050394]|uniref:hypothetical protein n=1 Tax=Nonomuraea sp. NPDC050394 TaxID=3364363 RepID=UPI0037B8805E
MDQVVLLFATRALTDDDLTAITLDTSVVDAHCLAAPGPDLPVPPLLAEQLAHLTIYGRGHYLEQNHAGKDPLTEGHHRD